MNFAEAYQNWRGCLSDALDKRYYTAEWLDWMVMSGRAAFWSGKGSAIVAEVRYYPSGAKVLHSVAAAGDLEEISSVLIPISVDWAKEQGCSAAIIESREGWTRKMKSQGFNLYKTAIRKEI